MDPTNTFFRSSIIEIRNGYLININSSDREFQMVYKTEKQALKSINKYEISYHERRIKIIKGDV